VDRRLGEEGTASISAKKGGETVRGRGYVSLGDRRKTEEADRRIFVGEGSRVPDLEKRV